jgi:hypothetical protein
MVDMWWEFFLMRCAPPLAVVGVLVICARDILWSLGWSGIRNGTVGGRSDVTAVIEGDPEFRRLSAELEELGFVPAGVLWEKAYLTRKIHEAVLLRRDGSTTAKLYRLSGGIPMLGFETVFERGGAVVTTNGRESVQRSDDTIRESVPTSSASRVLNRHEENVAALVAAGRNIRRSLSLDDAQRDSLTASRHPEVLRSLRSAARGRLKAKLIVFVALPGLFLLLGVAGHATWGDLLGMLGFMVLFFEFAYCVLVRMWPAAARQQLAMIRDEADYRTGTNVTEQHSDISAQAALELAREAQDSPVWRWERRLADWLVARAGMRVQGFDLRRGWLSADDRLDVVESFLFPDPPGRDETDMTASWPSTAWEDMERALRRSLVLAEGIVTATGGRVLMGVAILIAVAVKVAVAGVPIDPGRLVLCVGLTLMVLGSVLSAVVWAIAAASARSILLLSFGKVIDDGDGLRIECWHPKNEFLALEASRKGVILLRRDERGNATLHGQARFWHPAGERAGEVHFVDGRPEGPVSVWYANGQLKLEGQWADGRREGWWRRYSDTGQELAAEEYQAGRRIRGTGAMEDEWDEVSRYHWAVPIAFDAQRLKRTKVSPSWKKSRRRWQLAFVLAISALLVGLGGYLAR